MLTVKKLEPDVQKHTQGKKGEVREVESLAPQENTSVCMCGGQVSCTQSTTTGPVVYIFCTLYLVQNRVHSISGTDRRPKTLKSAVQRQKMGSKQMQVSLLTRSSLICFVYARRA